MFLMNGRSLKVDDKKETIFRRIEWIKPKLII